MTEKQYKVGLDNLNEYSVLREDNSIVVTEIQHEVTAELFCDELNELAEENEQLKSDNKCYVKRYSELFNEYKKIKKENEQLKTYLEALREELSLADRDNTVLIKENEQLKNSDTITDLETQIMKLKSKNKRIHEFESGYRERNLKLEKENKELKTVLKKTLKQLYNAQTSQIYEYSTNITEEEKQLKEHFKQKYSKYGWKE